MDEGFHVLPREIHVRLSGFHVFPPRVSLFFLRFRFMFALVGLDFSPIRAKGQRTLFHDDKVLVDKPLPLTLS
jgi:hypothetical protein